MKDTELNQILKRAEVPERPAAYWENFPGQVMAQIQKREAAAQASKPAEHRSPGARRLFPQPAGLDFPGWWRLGRVPALALGLAVICLGLGFVLGFWKGQRPASGDPQLAEIQKCFRELQGLFPNQLQALVFDERGPQVVLAEKANVPASVPLYVKIYGPKGCQRIVTFSGQQIRVNGDVCEVLVDHRGHVLVVGAQWVWSSSEPSAQASGYRIEARPLPINS